MILIYPFCLSIHLYNVLVLYQNSLTCHTFSSAYGCPVPTHSSFPSIKHLCEIQIRSPLMGHWIHEGYINFVSFCLIGCYKCVTDVSFRVNLPFPLVKFMWVDTATAEWMPTPVSHRFFLLKNYPTAVKFMLAAAANTTGVYMFAPPW